MEEYIKWLENKIEVCLEDKDLQREHWAFCQALKKYRELVLRQPLVSNRYTLQDMIDAYDAGVWNPNDETAKEYMKRKYNVC
jgi:hypothetical protein